MWDSCSSWLYVMLLHFLHDWLNWSSPSFPAPRSKLSSYFYLLSEDFSKSHVFCQNTHHQTAILIQAHREWINLLVVRTHYQSTQNTQIMLLSRNFIPGIPARLYFSCCRYYGQNSLDFSSLVQAAKSKASFSFYSEAHFCLHEAVCSSSIIILQLLVCMKCSRKSWL